MPEATQEATQPQEVQPVIPTSVALNHDEVLSLSMRREIVSTKQQEAMLLKRELEQYFISLLQAKKLEGYWQLNAGGDKLVRVPDPKAKE